MGDLCETDLTRRRLLGTAGALFAWGFAPRLASAAGTRDGRLVTVVLRGALDGLSAVAPLGDPAYADVRGPLALAAEGKFRALPLDGHFFLHPALTTLAELYARKQATFVHAVATPYRSRSHFDGQDVLESGRPGPGDATSGWMNRLAGVLDRGERVDPAGALAVGIVPPLILAGPAPVLGWAPTLAAGADPALLARLAALYEALDPGLHAALSAGIDVGALAAADAGTKASDVVATMKGAARIMAEPGGPRLAALALDGWDTHAKAGGAEGRLAMRLAVLDGGIAAIRDTLGPLWDDTVVLVVTEFGRTVAVNGSVGTDHGTGTVATLLGGAVDGGRVIADWPGLGRAALHEGRDLRPTTDLRAVVKGLLADLFPVDAATLAEVVFPGSADVRPMTGLIA